MPADSITRRIMRSIFSWKMLFMLIGSAVVFGGVFFKIFSGFAAMQEQMASMPVPVINVTAQPSVTQDWGIEVPAIGVLEARRGVDVSPSMPGLIQQIAFESGDKVTQGQMLVRLDPLTGAAIGTWHLDRVPGSIVLLDGTIWTNNPTDESLTGIDLSQLPDAGATDPRAG